MSQPTSSSPLWTKPLNRRTFLVIGGGALGTLGALGTWALDMWSLWPAEALDQLRKHPEKMTLTFDRSRTRPGREVFLHARWTADAPLPAGATLPVGLFADRRAGARKALSSTPQHTPLCVWHGEIALSQQNQKNQQQGWQGSTRFLAPLLPMDDQARAEEGYSVTAKLLLGDTFEGDAQTAPFLEVIVSPFSIGG